MKRLLIFLITLSLLLCPAVEAKAAEGYTYNYDYWGLTMYSPDSYEVKEVLTFKELGLDISLKAPQGLFIQGNLVYICDTGNNRIVEIKYENDTYSVLRVIDSFTGDCEITTFNTPSDIYVTESGTMFIADTNNNRVVKIDKDLNFLLEFTRPTDETFDQNLTFFPVKVVVDDVERVYILGTNINKGLIKFEADGSFKGFIGASKVSYTTYEYFKRKLQTKEQRARSESFVPTEYENIYMDEEGFIYAVTTVFEEDDLIADKAMPIRKLNALGTDILIKNDWYPPIGDLDWTSYGSYVGPSLITDLTAMSNGIYFALDRNRGRIFAYNEQGQMLYVFGGNGNIDGYFRKPVAIEHMGRTLFVLDSLDNSVTVFTPTTYGTLIYDAIDCYENGDYYQSSDYWNRVLALNGNYTMAYVGIGRVLLRENRYKEAMDYFEVAYNDMNYSKAFKLYRKEVIENNILYVFVGIIVVVAIWIIISRIRKVRGEVAEYEFKFSKH